jgi:predicted O-methyltransferase YrrM
MMTPVMIQQHEQELGMVLEVYRAIGPRRVLEIGSLYGGTLYHWIGNALPGAMVASIDLPVTPRVQELRSKWQEWADGAGVTLFTWEADSRSPSAIAWARKLAPFDFIFVDGDHAKSIVEQDFANYFPMLRPGGRMAFHDICAPDNHPVIGAGRWWRELRASGRYQTAELVRDGAPDSAGIGLVWRDE